MRLAMIPASVCLAAAALLAQPLAGQERVALRAGEHRDFSRIALDIPGLETWNIRQRGRSVILRFPERALDIDTAAIFPERRVSRVTRAQAESGPDGAELTLSLSCACTAEAYEFQPGMLVVDIRDDDDQASTEEPRAGDAGADPEPAEGATPLADGPAAVDATPLDPAGAEVSERQDAENAPPERRARDESSAVDRDATSVDQARERLLEQLSRAADQGLVQFRSPPEPGEASRAAPTEAATRSRPEPADPSAPAAGDAGSALTAPESSPDPSAAGSRDDRDDPVQLEARTAFDTGTQPARAEPPDCRAGRWLKPESFRRPEAPYAALGALRGRLAREFDEPDRQTALELARLQIALGFGAEARRTLQAFAPDDDAAALLVDVAHVVEDAPAPSDGPLAAAEGCGARTEMWRLAGGHGELAGRNARSAAALATAFEALPVSMRRLIGPRLVEGLVTQDATDLAAAVALRLDRAPGDHGDAWRLATARLALSRDRIARGETLLGDVVARDGPLAATALLALAESRLDRAEPLAAALISDLGAAAFKRRGTDLGRRLLVAESLGWARQGDLMAALDGLDTEIRAARLGDDDLEAALIAVFSDTSARKVGYAAYAEAVLTHRGLIGSAPAFDEVRAHVAEQLAAAGLPAVGRKLLEPALARDGEAARLAAAATSTAMGKPVQALSHLDELAGRQAAELRAGAYAAQGRHARAWGSLAPFLPENAPERARFAWRGGDWAAAAKALPEEDPRSPLARWMAGGRASSAPAGEAGPETAFLAPAREAARPGLAASRNAMERAETARALLARALDDS